MLLLSKLKTVTGGFVLLAAVVAAAWACAALVSARAAWPRDDSPRTEEEPARASRDTRDSYLRPTEFREAEFVFRGAARGRKTVSLVVAGTSAPVLCLAVKEDLRVLVGGRQAGIDELRAGTRVAIRLDAANRVVEEIRTLERAEEVPVLKSASDLKDLQSPPMDEVLRALPQVPRGIPGVLEVFRDDITVVAERLTRRVDPPRFYPLVGEAELHHQHWKCTVYYRETVEYSYPYPARTKQPRTEVVYIDKDYLVRTR
jgi:hypothetical protein